MGRRYVFQGEEVSAPDRASRTIMWYDSDGWDIIQEARTKSGKHVFFTPKERSLDKIILHHGGTSPKRVSKTLAKRGISTHFGVWKGEVQQFVDLKDQTYASGHANKNSIGVDITQEPPTESRLEYFRDKQGLDIEVIDNPSSRGPDRILTLDPQTAQSTRDLILDMHEKFGVPLRIPGNPDGSYYYGTLTEAQVANFKGILAHLHTSRNKWDIPWIPEIFDPLVKAGIVKLVVVDDAPPVKTRSFKPRRKKSDDTTATIAVQEQEQDHEFFSVLPVKKKNRGGGAGGGLAVTVLALGAGYLAWKKWGGKKKK